MWFVRAQKDGRQVFYCMDDDHLLLLFRLGLDNALND